MNLKPLLAKLSVVIPAYNEGTAIRSTIERLHYKLKAHAIAHEILVVVDSATDSAWETLIDLQLNIPELRPFHNCGLSGFGTAVRHGLDQMTGDAVVIMMADESDDSNDAVRYWEILNEGYDCVFGSRFVKGGKVIGYPQQKLLLNRLANWFIMCFFQIRLNDTTNAFKAYRREVIDACRPLVSSHFNLTVELPLKAIIRGFEWKVIPIVWQNRKSGTTKLKLYSMSKLYLGTCLCMWREKYLKQVTSQKLEG